jgi:diguanylate cyclase
MSSAKSPSPTADKSANAPSPAQLAKAALKRLAEQKLEPTPDNYRQAYEAEAGITPQADKASGKVSDQAAPAGEAPSPAEDGERWSALISRILRGAERGGRQWTAARKKDSLQRVLEGSKNSAQRLHQRLSQLVASWDSDTLDSSLLEADTQVPAADTSSAANGPANPATTTSGADNTASMGKDLALTNAAPQGGHTGQPLDTLIDASTAVSSNTPSGGISPAWSQLAIHAMSQLADTVKAALPAAQARSDEAALNLQTALDANHDTALPDAQHEAARTQISQACEQARRVIDHRHHLISQLTGLCQSLTDSLMDLSEDDSWAQGQCQVMRHQLDEGLNSLGVRHVQQLLADTRERQRALKAEREAARQALKQLIHQMLQEIGELGSTTDRFHTSLGRYAETIGQADSLESLTGVVREMVEESRAVQTVVSQTQTRLNTEHARATELTERVRHLEEEIRKLSDEVSTDPLTQIANRRGMMRAFEQEQAKIARNGTVLAIGLLDVDNFKKLNDTLGHQTGDEALKFLARRVGECLRPVDVVARYGGEEFVVMLPETALGEAQQVLTRLQRTLSAEFFTHEDKKVFITFSAGVTLYRSGEAIEAALERADVALYEAKRTGKNRTCIG